MPGRRSSAYEFLTTWRVEGTCREVADILSDPVGLARWWPSVYLDVTETEPPDARGLGRRVRVLTKGWESRYPHGLAIEASGDFNGRGVWTFEQDGPGAAAAGVTLAFLAARAIRRRNAGGRS